MHVEKILKTTIHLKIPLRPSPAGFTESFDLQHQNKISEKHKRHRAPDCGSGRELTVFAILSIFLLTRYYDAAAFEPPNNDGMM